MIDLPLLVIRDKLIAAFAGKNANRDAYSRTREREEAPANGTEYPRDVELPAGEKAVIMIKLIRLRVRQSARFAEGSDVRARGVFSLGGLTTIAMPTICAKAARPISAHTTFHP